MDLRGICDGAIQTVNQNIIVTVQLSVGFVIGSGGKQLPQYETHTGIAAQLQAMTYSDLRQVDGLNIQGVKKSIYLFGSLSGVVRPNQQGGDLITIASQGGAAPQDVGTWLTVQVLESWPTWTKACIALQGGA